MAASVTLGSFNLLCICCSILSLHSPDHRPFYLFQIKPSIQCLTSDILAKSSCLARLLIDPFSKIHVHEIHATVAVDIDSKAFLPFCPVPLQRSLHQLHIFYLIDHIALLNGI